MNLYARSSKAFSINNEGTIQKQTGEGTSEFRTVFNNSGAIESLIGHILFSRDFYDIDGSEIENGGLIEITGRVIREYPAIDLRIEEVSGAPEIYLGEQLEYTWTGINIGFESTTSSFWADSVYLSDDNLFDQSDLLLESSPVDLSSLPLDSTDTYSNSALIQVPNTTAPGDYSLLFILDSQNRQIEEDKTNNIYDFSITVLGQDSNSAPTDILLRNDSIDENIEPNALVGTLQTIDSDLGDTFTYTPAC